MLQDLVGKLEAQTARLLADADHLAYFARHIEDLPIFERNQKKRLKAAVRRARIIRNAIIDAGVSLPALRAPGQNPEELEERRARLYADLDAQVELTVSQIAQLVSAHRITVVRWIEKAGGEAWRKYKDARRQGEPARFTPDEVSAILAQQGSKPAVK